MIKIKNNIPNFITLLNLLSGCFAILAVFKSDLYIASYLVFISAFFDYTDGLAAKLLNAKSEIGKELDSLADIVSFGVVPALIAFQLLSKNSNECPLFIGYHGLIYFPLIIVLFSAIRLAKFNIDNRQTISFLGIPTPANAIFWASIPLIINYADYHNTTFIDHLHHSASVFFQNPHTLILLSLIMSILLVVEIPLFSLKFKNMKWSDNKIRYIFILLSIILCFVFHLTSIPVIILLYILSSLIHQYLL